MTAPGRSSKLLLSVGRTLLVEADASCRPSSESTDSITRTRARLREVAEPGFGDVVKAVVDVRRRVMVVGGELHADEEQMLLDEGSEQADLWGINLLPDADPEYWIEFDSMINVRPSQGNRSGGVEDAALRDRIRAIVAELVPS